MDTGTAPPVAETPAAPTSAWMRLARGAAVVMVVWSVTLQVTVGTIIPPVAVIGLVFLAFVPFLTGERRRVGLALALFTTAAYLGNLPGILDELGHPESAPAFILTLLSTVGAVLALIGGLGAFFGRPSGPVRTLVLGAAGVFVAGTVMSVAMASATDADAALDADVAVTAAALEWQPLDIRLDSGATGVWVENQDGVRHTFTVKELGVDLEIPALTSRRIDIDAAPGTYQVICTVPGHEAMTGTLTVGS